METKIDELKKEVEIKKSKSGGLGKLFDSADAKDYSRLVWRIFMVYLGSKDCAKQSINDRVLAVELYNILHKYFMKKWREQDEQEEEIECIQTTC